MTAVSLNARGGLAAVTMLTMQYAKAMPDVRFNAADPGYTATDFNGHRGIQTVT